MKYYISALLFFILSGLTIAQDSSETNRDVKHGIQFQLGGLLDLRNFENYTFSYRYNFTDKSGIRIGLMTNLIEVDYDITTQLDTLISNPPEHGKDFQFKFSIQYLHRLLSYNSFNMILGGGPFLSYGKYDVEFGSLNTSYISSRKETNKMSGYGLDLIIGAEYELTNNVILSGECGLNMVKENSEIDGSLVYNYHDGSPDKIIRQKGEIDSFRINGMNVNLGLAVFF